MNWTPDLLTATAYATQSPHAVVNGGRVWAADVHPHDVLAITREVGDEWIIDASELHIHAM